MKIRLAKKSDLKDIINFIKKNYYKKNHILVTNKKIFNFFFLSSKNVNFIICIDNSKILGILGFIKNSHWSLNFGKNIVWLGWWQVLKGFNGLILIKNLIKFLNPKLLVSFGVQNKKVRNLLFRNIDLNQFVIRNNFYKKIFFKKEISFKRKITFENQEILIFKNKIEHFKLSKHYFPKKNYSYFKNKYLNNKFYDYFYLHFKNNHKLKTIFVCKSIYNTENKIFFIKILDIIGKLPNISFKKVILKLLKVHNVHYLDLQCSGIDEGAIINFGFTKNRNKIYNFYEPYKKIHSPHTLSFILNKYKRKKLIFFAGDGDNERPRI